MVCFLVQYNILFLQISHIENFIFFRLQMGIVDNIVAKCKYVPFLIEIFNLDWNVWNI